MTIRPVGDELIRADGRTDTTKLTVAFRNLQNRLQVLHSGHTEYLCLFCGSENKERLVSTDQFS
jgi:hypothetical protein